VSEALVLTKIHRYQGYRSACQIVGQPRSTIDFRQLVSDGKLVIVNLNASPSVKTWWRLLAGRC
jgi:hypothetical protein